MKKFIPYFKRLELQVVIALILAILFWIHCPTWVEYIAWFWDLFMKLLKSMLGPLLFFSITSAIIWLWDITKLWKLWAKTFYYYGLTIVIAIFTSLVMMNVFKPWAWLKFWFEEWFNSAQVEALSFGSFMQGLIPSNIVQSFVEFNSMQIVVMWIILWISILATKNNEQINLLWKLFNAFNDWILKFISYVIKLTPLWVFAIVALVVKQNWIDSITSLFPFIWIILATLAIHAFLVLPFIWYTIWKFNPYKYLLEVKEVILVWFSTASSSATMWLAMNTLKEKVKLNEEVVNFAIPIWTTVNMNGTAIYQAWVALFVAQVCWIDLNIMQQITVMLIVILASVWAAWVPWAWILILTTVFVTIWLPVEAIWIILAVDRMLDMFRTWVNVWGDLLTAKMIDNYYENKLKPFLDKVSDNTVKKFF